MVTWWANSEISKWNFRSHVPNHHPTLPLKCQMNSKQGVSISSSAFEKASWRRGTRVAITLSVGQSKTYPLSLPILNPDEGNSPALKFNPDKKLTELFSLENKQLVRNVLFPKWRFQIRIRGILIHRQERSGPCRVIREQSARWALYCSKQDVLGHR